MESPLEAVTVMAGGVSGPLEAVTGGVPGRGSGALSPHLSKIRRRYLPFNVLRV